MAVVPWHEQDKQGTRIQLVRAWSMPRLSSMKRAHERQKQEWAESQLRAQTTLLKCSASGGCSLILMIYLFIYFQLRATVMEKFQPQLANLLEKKTTCPLGAGKNRSSPQPKQLSKQTGVKQEMSRVKSEVGVVRERKSRTQEQSKPSEIKSKTPIMQPWIYPSTIF